MKSSLGLLAHASLVLLLLSGRTLHAQTAVHSENGVWQIENERLRVQVEPRTGALTVLDKDAGYTYRQPAPRQRGQAGPTVPIKRAATAPRIDADLSDWPQLDSIRITHEMTADAKAVDSATDCSATVRLLWDADSVFVAAVVTDDRLAFAETELEQWWEKDCIELWFGATQIGLSLSRTGSHARRAQTRADGGAEIAIADLEDGTGYRVEARLPWQLFGQTAVAAGKRMPFAIGINDADTSGQREGQIYFPATWRHSTPETFAEAALADAQGRVPAAAERKDNNDLYQEVSPTQGPAGIRFRTVVRTPQPLDLLITLTVPDGAPDVVLDIDTPDRSVTLSRHFVAVPPLLLDTPKGAVCVADYSNGHLYPLDMEPFPRWSFNANRLDMPWIGLVDLERGFGYALILETSDDCAVQLREESTPTGKTKAPVVEWWAACRTFNYPRRLRLSFRSRGGYVALAKAYREYADEQGLLVKLAEKADRNANVRRLFGAPDVWGNATLAFAREAKALGVDRMLIHGVSSPEDMAAINELGYLTSCYDNYTDILPLEDGKGIDHSHAPLPEHAVMNHDESRMKAWLTFDKQTQYMKRCPALWLEAARRDIPKALATYPYLGRFIDVTTAEALYECFDPKHPLTRTQKRQCGEELERYVWSLGLVGGGEHGLWWGVPAMCYIEGMMSGGNYSWPAGHLKHPKSKDEELGNPWGHKLPPFAQYEKLGIGHEFRIPLWELVFHDCIVSTWYWGDASDWLLDAAPEVTPKKDAFNILYGTIPLLWANGAGAWVKDRSVFLRTYRTTCKLHEQIAGEEMLTHEFVTADRALQRTIFSSGTVVVVNFGVEPKQAAIGNETFVLPQNGFAVRGPKIKQSLQLEDGVPVTRIEMPAYSYRSAGGVEFTLEARSADTMAMSTSGSAEPITVAPLSASSTWDVASTRLYRLDERGNRVDAVDVHTDGGRLRFGPLTESTRLEAVCRAAASRPDLALRRDDLRLSADRVQRGAPLTLTTAIRNVGLAPARGILAVFADAMAPERELLRVPISLEPGQALDQSVQVPTGRLAGERRLLVALTVAEGVEELCTLNNLAATAIRVHPELTLWPYRVPVMADAGAVDRAGQAAVLAVDFGPVMKRLGVTDPLDAAALRVGAVDDAGEVTTLLPTQFDPAPGFDPVTNPKGELLWIPNAPFPAGTQRRYVILLRTGEPALLPACGRWDADRAEVDMDGYTARFSNGVLTSIRAKSDGVRGPDFIESIILSSKETGWVDEEASEVREMSALSSGPVRCTVRVAKALKDSVETVKTYTFYHGRFDIDIRVNKQAGGLYSRAHYELPCRYVDDKGVEAEIDGDGAENRDVYGRNKSPRWYAVLGTGWSHSCIALSEFDHVAYWDGNNMGSVGFVGPKQDDCRISYVIHAAQQDARFAEADWKRLTTPFVARLATD